METFGIKKMENSRMAPIKIFYDAFCVRDGETMASLYADDVEFQDPVFPQLRGEYAKSMWRMLCEKGADLAVTYEIISSDGDTHKVRWDARYTFTGTGQQVHNKVLATLVVKDGKITKHTDQFSFWRWSRQALGVPGLLLGWTPVLQKKVQNRARKSLEAYMAQKKN